MKTQGSKIRNLVVKYTTLGWAMECLWHLTPLDGYTWKLQITYSGLQIGWHRICKKIPTFKSARRSKLLDPINQLRYARQGCRAYTASLQDVKQPLASEATTQLPNRRPRRAKTLKKPRMNEESLRTSVLNRRIPKGLRPDPLVQVGVGGWDKSSHRPSSGLMMVLIHEGIPKKQDPTSHSWLPSKHQWL